MKLVGFILILACQAVYAIDRCSTIFEAHSLDNIDRGAISYYTSGGSFLLNRELRDKSFFNKLFSNTFGNGLRAQSNQLITALDKLPSYNGIVYRGIGLDTDELNSILNKKELKNNIFFSCSKRKNTALIHLSSSYKDQAVLFIIHAKTGKDISNYSNTPEEEEVLFKPGQSFNIRTAIDRDKYLEIVLDEAI